MSHSNFMMGQPVTIGENHNQFITGTTIYHIAKIDRVLGQNMLMLSLDGKIVGVLPESKARGK